MQIIANEKHILSAFAESLKRKLDDNNIIYEFKTTTAPSIQNQLGTAIEVPMVVDDKDLQDMIDEKAALIYEGIKYRNVDNDIVYFHSLAKLRFDLHHNLCGIEVRCSGGYDLCNDTKMYRFNVLVSFGDKI